MMKACLRFFWTCIVCIFSASSQAIIMSPTVLEIDTQSGGMAQVVVTNNSTQKVPLETSLRRLIFQPDGGFISQQIEDGSLLFFPLATVLQPGQSQVFRLQWVGAELTTSESYFLRFSQPLLASEFASDSNALTSNLSQQDSGISVQVNYNALVHIFSNNQNAKVSLHVSEDGSVTLKNSGNRYTYTELLHFFNTENRWQTTLNKALGEHFIPPMSSIVITPVQPIPAGDYRGIVQ